MTFTELKKAELDRCMKMARTEPKMATYWLRRAAEAREALAELKKHKHKIINSSVFAASIATSVQR